MFHMERCSRNTHHHHYYYKYYNYYHHHHHHHYYYYYHHNSPAQSLQSSAPCCACRPRGRPATRPIVEVVVGELLHRLAGVAVGVGAVGVGGGLPLAATFAAMAGVHVLVLLHAHHVVSVHVVLLEIRRHRAAVRTRPCCNDSCKGFGVNEQFFFVEFCFLQCETLTVKLDNRVNLVYFNCSVSTIKVVLFSNLSTKPKSSTQSLDNCCC